MRWKIYHSARFEQELSKYDLFFQKQVEKIEIQLGQNPFAGDSLNSKWFREKRIGGKRIYYLIYEDLKIIFMVAISGKKDQQKTIDTIRLIANFLRDEIEDIMKNDFT